MEMLIALILFVAFFLYVCLDGTSTNTAHQQDKKTAPQPKSQPVYDCDSEFKIDFRGLDCSLSCKYYSWDELYKATLLSQYFDFVFVSGKDKDNLQQALQIIVDKWAEAKGRRIEFSIIDLTKWNGDEIGLSDYVLQHIISDEEESLDSDTDDDAFDISDDYDSYADCYDDTDVDDDFDIDDDLDLGDDLDDSDDFASEPEDERQAKKKAKRVDLKSAKRCRSILRHMASRLDEMENQISEICNDMEDQRGNIGIYPSLREMHENLENLRGNLSQIADRMREA